MLTHHIFVWVINRLKKGNYYKEAHCCNAIWDVIFTSRTEEFIFRKKKVTEWTWGCGLFCLRCIGSPVRKNHVKTTLDFLCNMELQKKGVSGKLGT